MPRESTTQLRELAMQISRLLDQFAGDDAPSVVIRNELNRTLSAVDEQINDIERPGPPA